MSEKPGRETPGSRFRLLMFAFIVSAIAVGAMTPFTAILINGELGHGLGGVSIFFAVVGASGFLFGLWGGVLVDRRGARATAVAGFAAAASGYILLAHATDLRLLVTAAIFIGLGDGLYRPAFTTAVVALVPVRLQRRAFSHRYFVMNLGLGVGALIAGFAADRVEGSLLRSLFLFNGLAYVPLAVAFWVALRGTSRSAAAAASRAGGYRVVIRHRRLVLLLTVQFGIAAFGFVTFSRMMPLLVNGGMGQTLGFVGLLFAANTIAIVTLQPILTRFLERFREARVLSATAVIWMLAFLFGAAATAAPAPWAAGLLLFVPVLFAVGEATYSSSFHPLLAQIVPDVLLGRASALATLAYSGGQSIGPIIGVALIARVPTVVSWLAAAALVTLCGLPSLLAARVRDSAPTAPSRHPEEQVLTPK